MNQDFDEVWLDIQKRLMSGTLVRYWSAEKGYTGGAFRIYDVSNTTVTVRHGQTGHERQIPKSDFRRLFVFWDAQNRGTMGQERLANSSEDATYIQSILQWRDEAQISAAPTLRTSSLAIPPPRETGSATGLSGHHDYGKWVLHEATEGRAVFSGPSVEIAYGNGPPAPVDATVGNIAIEIEAGISKQVRGAILDLICHPHPRKLLILLPDHITSRGITAEQCRSILKRFCPEGSFRVLVLKGNGRSPQPVDDAAIVAAVLTDLQSG